MLQCNKEDVKLTVVVVILPRFSQFSSVSLLPFTFFFLTVVVLDPNLGEWKPSDRGMSTVYAEAPRCKSRNPGDKAVMEEIQVSLKLTV